jgi:hypothetical protein
MLNTDTYGSIKARLDDWLECSGGSVANLSLDLLNRAQRSLCLYLPWDYLIKTQALVLTGKTAPLPLNFDKMIDVYSDSDGDGKPDFHFFNNSSYADNGYKIVDLFTAQSGHALSITFYASPSNQPYIKYQASLSDFNGITEGLYSFFPGDLLLLEAQYIHITEMGIVGPEYNTISTRRDEQLRDYRQAHMNIGQDQRMVQNDIQGAPIEFESYSLDGNTAGFRSDNHLPSYDR